MSEDISALPINANDSLTIRLHKGFVFKGHPQNITVEYVGHPIEGEDVDFDFSARVREIAKTAFDEAHQQFLATLNQQSNNNK